MSKEECTWVGSEEVN